MAVEAQTAAPRIGAGTAIGTVRLTVHDLDRSRQFYEQLLGLDAEDQPDAKLQLSAPPRGDFGGHVAAKGGPPGGVRPPLLELRSDPTAPARDPRLTGLFHLAILVPTRRALAISLLRLAQGRWPLSGASDHLVSEALYLNDPDGNGIEVYRDRDPSEWGYDHAGQLQMATLPLDLDALVGELDDAPADPQSDRSVPPATRIGHVHLQVAELREIEAFYAGVLGFDVTVRSYPGALFVSAGGYHHHIGLNTWHSRGAAAPPPGAVGLASFDVKLEDQRALDEVLKRVEAAGLATEPGPAGATLVRDPSGNAVVLTV